MLTVINWVELTLSLNLKSSLTRFLGIGPNALNCAHGYTININDISTDCVIITKCIIMSYFNELVGDDHYYTSCCVREPPLLRDNALHSYFEQCSFFVWRPWTNLLTHQLWCTNVFASTCFTGLVILKCDCLFSSIY